MNKKKDKEALPEDQSFGTLLKWFRTHRNLSEQGLARKIKKHPNTISAWESHRYLPATRETVLAVARALYFDDADTDCLLFAAQYPLLGEHERSEPKHIQETAEQQTRMRDVSSTFSSLWGVPHRHNPYFTGRHMLLAHLHDTLFQQKIVAVTHSQAISGLGGIGKTQVALEYAYRYRQDYKTVFWVHADSRETLLSDFVGIANLLKLPEKAEQDQTSIVSAVKRWFDEHTAWLLILDNADDFTAVHEYMPTLGEGHILLTTRAHSVGQLAPHPIELDVMDPEEGMLLLLRRAGILSIKDSVATASEKDRVLAYQLVQEAGGLPLALDQAGAYIEETGCSLSRYLELYKTHLTEILKRPDSSFEYPHTVATTWSLSFQWIEENNPIAAEILRLCAFLQPDAIPEDIFTEGGDDLGPDLSPVAGMSLLFDTAMETLLKYSLVKRNPETRTVTIHRLVQVALKDAMNSAQQHQWAERTVRVLNRIFPEIDLGSVNVALWERCEQYLPQLQNCFMLIEQYDLTLPEAARLLFHGGSYLDARGRYKEVEPYYKRALIIREHIFGPEHADVASIINNMGILYWHQGKFAEAASYYQCALRIKENVLGPEHADIAAILHNLAILYRNQGKYAEAEPCVQRALTIQEKTSGSDHPRVATILINLAALSKVLGKYVEAESLLERALRIRQQALEPNHPSIASSMNNLGEVYLEQGKYSEAEIYFQRAFHIKEKSLGVEHLDTAGSMNNLGNLYRIQGKYTKAEFLLKRAFTLREKALGLEHPDVARSMNNLGDLYADQGNYTEAISFYQRALIIREKVLGREHPDTLVVREKLTLLLQKVNQKNISPERL